MAGELYVAILAGGSGRRFWPLGRRRRPKPFLPLVGGRSLLRLTWERLLTLCPAERILVVGGCGHEKAILRELPELSRANLLLEPVPRDTAAAVAAAAVAFRTRAGDVPFLTAPADHHIADAAPFRKAIRSGLPHTSSHLIAFGLTPRRPDPAFGYLVAGEMLAGGPARRVRRFVEKPPADGAARLIREGGVFWNSGVFLWRTERILAAIGRHLPALGAVIGEFQAAIRRKDPILPASVYERLEPISIDHAVLEKTGELAVVPAEFPWQDLGSWSAARAQMPDRGQGNRGLGRLVVLDAAGNTVVHPDGITGLVGVQNLVVVYSDNALLVCHRDRSEDVKNLVELLEQDGEEEYL